MSLTNAGLRIVCVLAVSASAIHAATDEEARYHNGDVELAASLLLPARDGPHPAIVIVQGSGTSDRSNRWSRDFAELFVDLDMAVLLTDKRGSGESGGDWRTSSFQDLARDTLAGVRFLASHDTINSDAIGVVGLSQGGQVAAIAATLSDQIAFVVSISSKAVGFAEGSFIEMTNTARQSGLSTSNVKRVLRVNRAALRYITRGDWATYNDARRELLHGPTRAIAEGFPDTPDQPVWEFLRSAIDHDPLYFWLQVDQPVLIVYGEEDETDNAPVKESVRRLTHAFSSVQKTNYDIVVFPNAGHSLRDRKSHELAPALRMRLGHWLAKTRVSEDK